MEKIFEVMFDHFLWCASLVFAWGWGERLKWWAYPLLPWATAYMLSFGLAFRCMGEGTKQ